MPPLMERRLAMSDSRVSDERLSPQHLASLVRQKRSLLEQLQTLCENQKQTIEADDAERLLRILTAKQKLVSGLERIERELAPFRDQDPETRPWGSEQERQACRADVQASERLWEGILELEAWCGKELEERRQALAQRLTAAQAQTNARQAYLSTAPTMPAQFDCRAE